MKRKIGKRFGCWEFRVDGVIHKVEVRSCEDANREIMFAAELPGAPQILRHKDPNELQKMIRDMLTKTRQLKWEKVLLVRVSCDRDSHTDRQLRYDKEGDHGLTLRWETYERAVNPNTDEHGSYSYIWRKDKSRGAARRYMDKHERVITWTLERENILKEISLHMGGIAERLEKFFEDTDIEKRLDSVSSVVKMLSPGKD